MDFVALLSGGKDSCYNTFQCIQHGNRLRCLAHLRPTPLENEEGEETNSFMYQTAGSTVLKAYEECFGVPMIQRQILGGSINTGLEYNEPCTGDEVEDLFELLKDVKDRFPSIKAVACGAILSNYQRHRLEHVCGRLGLTVLSYLWQKDRKELLEEMIFEHQMEIMLVKVAGAGLQPRKHLGKRLKDIYPQLLNLNKKYGLDLCGEGGEYESLVLDAPFFHKKIEILSSKIIEDPEDPDVGNLFVLEHRIVDKSPPADEAPPVSYPRFTSCTERLNQSLHHSLPPISSQLPSSKPVMSTCNIPMLRVRNPVKINWKADGFGHTELVIARSCSIQSFTEITEMQDIYRNQLEEVMNRLVYTLVEVQNVKVEDIVFVHLYLHDITMFAVVNEVYCRYFHRYPPSRSCVQLDLSASGSFIAVEACILRNSYEIMQRPPQYSSIPPPIRREVLHVQSMSQWAPLCIGPYCQANILQDFFLLVAGQIPLQPGTMTLRPHTPSSASTTSMQLSDLLLDLTLCLRHVHRVLSVLQSDLHHLLSVIVYINLGLFNDTAEVDAEIVGECQSLIQSLCYSNKFVGDSGVAIGDAISANLKQTKEGYDCEDEEEQENDEVEKDKRDCFIPPIVVIGVPGLPRNASCEIEVVAAKEDKIRPNMWKVESLEYSGSSGSTDIVTSNLQDIDTWGIWATIPSSTTSSSPSSQSSSLSGQVTVKSYPGVVCSGVIDVLAPGKYHINFTVQDAMQISIQLLQQSLQTIASMRTNRILYIKLLYDPTLFDNIHPSELILQWQETWHFMRDQDNQRHESASSSSFSLVPSSVIPLPVKLLPRATKSSAAATTTELEIKDNAIPIFQVLYFAEDAQQLEAESWVKLAANHCQGS